MPIGVGSVSGDGGSASPDAAGTDSAAGTAAAAAATAAAADLSQCCGHHCSDICRMHRTDGNNRERFNQSHGRLRSTCILGTEPLASSGDEALEEVEWKP